MTDILNGLAQHAASADEPVVGSEGGVPQDLAPYAHELPGATAGDGRQQVRVVTEHHEPPQGEPPPIWALMRDKSRVVSTVPRPATKSAMHGFALDQTRAQCIARPDRFRKRILLMPPSAGVIIGTQELVGGLANTATAYTLATTPAGLLFLANTLTVPIPYESEEALWAIAASNAAAAAVLQTLEETYSGGPSVD